MKLKLMRNMFLGTAFTLFSTAFLTFTSCEKVVYMDSEDSRNNSVTDENSSAHINDEGWMVYTPDTLTNFRNPGMGWTIYEEGWCFLPEGNWSGYNFNRFWSEIEASNATSWCNILYVRCLWGDLETEEGVYAWDDPNSTFSKFVQKAKEHNLKLAFRIFFHGDKCVPQYVKDKGAVIVNTITDPKPHPKVDDPVFLNSFDKFLSAFSAKFDNPDLVDYIDGYNIGHWGEGNTDNILYHNSENKEMVIDVLTSMYAKHFKKVLTCTTFADHNAGMMRKHAFGKNGLLPRRDGVGGPTPSGEQSLILEYTQNKKTAFIGESWFWFNTGESCGTYPNPDDFNNKMRHTVNHMLQLHSNVCDARVPLECQWWEVNLPDQVQKFITNGGYRLYPDMIKFNQKDHRFSMLSIWRNYAQGILPNNHPNWNKKYQVTFALVDKDGNSKFVVSDQKANPGDWTNGVVNKSTGNGSVVCEKKEDNKYFYITPFEVPLDITGEYTLCVGITDKTKNDEPGLDLAIPEDMKIGKWVKIANVKL